MAFADVTKYNLIRSMKGLPIGAIIPWSSDASTIPAGWTVCNGAVLSISKYPILSKVIGNSYGGVAGSTFKLPPLTSGSPGIVDQYQGHYSMLTKAKYNNGQNGNNDAHKIYSNSLSADPYWQIVGGGSNGDEGSTQQTFWISTIDLVGEEIKTDVDFQAIYDDMEVAEGSFFFSTNYNQVNLGVEHMTNHSHSDPSTDPTSYDRGGSTITRCTGTVWQSETCKMSCDSAEAYRVAAVPATHVKVSYGNNASDLEKNFVFSNAPTGWTSNGGGGNAQPTTAYAQKVAGHYKDGTGRCEGNMKCGNLTLFTNKSHDEVWQSAPHGHNPNNYNLEGKFQVISPGLRTNIKLNTVRIDNTPGINYGTINVETATASLEMMYIIRAY